MPETFLETRWGGGGRNPTIDNLRAALAELDRPDEEHPDCWLTDENGWTISAHESGKAVMENPESDAGPWHMIVDRQGILELWLLLQAGDLDAIQAKSWINGY